MMKSRGNDNKEAGKDKEKRGKDNGEGGGRLRGPGARQRKCEMTRRRGK